MFRIRSRISSMLIRPSARARGPPGQERAPTEGDVGLGVGPVQVEVVRALEATRVAVGGAVEQHHRRPRGDVDPADRGVAPGEPEVGLDRALDPESLLHEVGYAVLVGAQLVLEQGAIRRPVSGERRTLH
jgi:hypothetical protein